MLKALIGRVFGTRHERERKRVQPVLAEIHEIEARLALLSDGEIQGQTAKFRQRLAEQTAPIESRIAELKAAKHDH
jgi:preprotein translocase subunit SecA